MTRVRRLVASVAAGLAMAAGDASTGRHEREGEGELFVQDGDLLAELADLPSQLRQLAVPPVDGAPVRAPGLLRDRLDGDQLADRRARQRVAVLRTPQIQASVVRPQEHIARAFVLAVRAVVHR